MSSSFEQRREYCTAVTDSITRTFCAFHSRLTSSRYIRCIACPAH